MEESKLHFRHIMLYYYRKGRNATKARKKICDVYGANAVSYRLCQFWFAKFRAGDFTIEDAPRSGRPVKINKDQILTILESNPRQTTREIAEMLKISKSSVENHLHKLGFVNLYDIWVPHKLTDENLKDRVTICSALLKRHEKDNFLKRMIMGDEKFIVFNIIEPTKSETKGGQSPLAIPRPTLHEKVILCIWWDWKGVVYYELLSPTQKITSVKYSSQIDKLKAAIDERRPELANCKGIIFHQDTRPQLSLGIHQKLMQLGWDVLPHPPHSPDFAPSDYHVFRSLQNSLNGKTFENLDSCRIHLEEFFNEKSGKLFEDKIMRLPEKWQKVIEQNGRYIV